jgi:protein SCO1/2
VNGIVKEVKMTTSSVVVAHEAIDGYMEAMTMEFQAENVGDLANLHPGDAIAFRLNVADRRGWIDQVKLVKAAAEQPYLVTNHSGADKAGTLRSGDLLTDCLLVDQDNRSFRLSDLRGYALAVTFIFTRCPYPDFCPRMAQNFRRVKEEFEEDPAVEKWKLLSVSIDPAYDTPDRLAAYAKALGAPSERWLFATGDPGEISSLSRAFGLNVMHDGKQLNHNLRTAVVDADGRLQKVFIGNAWSPAELAAELRRAMAGR